MRLAPFPVDESRRLCRLRALGVLDSLPESFSESVVSAAAAIANVPISAISLIDGHRQWFKGSCGLEVAETPRDISFCGHAILDKRPMIVADASLDERFLDNPLVLGPPHVRFYAGFPIVPGGYAVGVLCVVDDRPRQLDARQAQRLATLALATAGWLHLRARRPA